MARQQQAMPRNFGGIRFPERAEPQPGPLGRLALELARERRDDVEPAMSPAVRGMLADLPAGVRTLALQKRHMPVLDQLARNWGSPHMLRELFDGLIFEGRKAGVGGLSFEAIVELTELDDYVKRVRLRNRPSVWDEALGLV